jgi:hypothetical protein
MRFYDRNLNRIKEQVAVMVEIWYSMLVENANSTFVAALFRHDSVIRCRHSPDTLLPLDATLLLQFPNHKMHRGLIFTLLSGDARIDMKDDEYYLLIRLASPQPLLPLIRIKR